MTYSEAFSLWVAEVYRNHGYEPGQWYGSEVAETLYNEAIATYNGPPATMRDYIEAIPSADEFAYLDYAIEQERYPKILASCSIMTVRVPAESERRRSVSHKFFRKAHKNG